MVLASASVVELAQQQEMESDRAGRTDLLAWTLVDSTGWPVKLGAVQTCFDRRWLLRRKASLGPAEDCELW